MEVTVIRLRPLSLTPWDNVLRDRQGCFCSPYFLEFPHCFSLQTPASLKPPASDSSTSPTLSFSSLCFVLLNPNPLLIFIDLRLSLDCSPVRPHLPAISYTGSKAATLSPELNEASGLQLTTQGCHSLLLTPQPLSVDSPSSLVSCAFPIPP